ncbi:MAG: SdpI family protein [Clostridium sp.]|uniref:SdpI family protein n=1 Tax=Clostridium sp. TaxID=1506 RepID=UPI003F2E669A
MDKGLWVTYLLIPSVMVILGIILKMKPPKKINHFYGYRTTRSMASQKAWDYAQVTYGKLWLNIGAVLFISIILWKFIINKSEEDSSFIITFIELVALLLPIPIIEKRLKSIEKN